MRLGVAFGLLLVLGLLSPTAHADSAMQVAKLHYQEGTKRYNLADYAKALDEFKAAYLAKSDPAFLFNIAQCQRQLADYEAAARSYRAFLREGSELQLGTREQVQKLVGDMEQAARDAREKARQPPAGTVPPHEESKTALEPPSPPVAAPPEMRTTSRLPSPGQQPVWRRGWFWGVVAGVVVVGVGVGVGVGVAFGSQHLAPHADQTVAF